MTQHESTNERSTTMHDDDDHTKLEAALRRGLGLPDEEPDDDRDEDPALAAFAAAFIPTEKVSDR